MPTGGGKSLCYQIPALVREGTGVVISPLIALMQDQVDALAALGVRAAFLNSTQEPSERRAVESAYLAGELDLLYLAPERLRCPRRCAAARPRHASRCSRSTRRTASSQWGHDFRPDYLAARRCCTSAGPTCRGSRSPRRRPRPPHAEIAARLELDRRAAFRRELRPAEHPVPHRAQGQAARAAARPAAHRAPRRRRHRLLPVAQVGGADRRSS